MKRENKKKENAERKLEIGGNMTNEEKIIDLLQKLIIVSLYKEGVTRNEIQKILSISTNKISEVVKYLNKKKRKENE